MKYANRDFGITRSYLKKTWRHGTSGLKRIILRITANPGRLYPERDSKVFLIVSDFGDQ